MLREELGISYLLIFVGLVAILTSRNYECVVVKQFYGLDFLFTNFHGFGGYFDLKKL